MKIGYACQNLTLGCSSAQSFRLINYSEKRLVETIDANLKCLLEILNYNKDHNIYFFRISSDLIPFASHPVNNFSWNKKYKPIFKEIGNFIKANQMRVCTHPDQFIILNSLDMNVLHNSIRELNYHAQLFELMNLDYSHKIQIHLGGAYGDKKASTERFIKEFKSLPNILKKRLAIENDDRIYTVEDCLNVSKIVNIPVVVDYLHYAINNTGQSFRETLHQAVKTWQEEDGAPIVDFSSQAEGKRPGAHADSIDIKEFKRFIDQTNGIRYDLMLEIKDKEKSAIRTIKYLDKNKNS